MKDSTRQELEQYVIAYNVCLKEVVQNMNLITLLRNAHPTYRGNFAMALLNDKMISRNAAKEFTKIV